LKAHNELLLCKSTGQDGINSDRYGFLDGVGTGGNGWDG
jgi:hypothetical protein